MAKIWRRERTGTEGKQEEETVTEVQKAIPITQGPTKNTTGKSIADFCNGPREVEALASFQLESFGYLLQNIAINSQLQSRL